jgi:hypothetical protein
MVNRTPVDTERNQHITARVTTEIKEKLKVLAKNKKMSVSDYVFYVLTNHVRGRDKYRIFHSDDDDYIIEPRKGEPPVDDNEDFYY